ncbi:MAG: hypothetical protein DLM69_05580 [Candidatus Chloroheliales bacterium]|nr:MAG: hypothetical protein DLM69_05580 [Chloroflexota bacterium]
MDESAKPNPGIGQPANEEQVLIDDYRGPLAGPLTPISQAGQIAALPEEKQDSVAALYAEPTDRPQDDFVTWSNRGMRAAAVAAGTWLAILTIPAGAGISLCTDLFNLGLAIFGLLICTMTFFHARESSNPNLVLNTSRIGIALSSAVLAVILLRFVFGL